MVVSAIPPVVTGVNTADSRRFEYPIRYGYHEEKRLASLGLDRSGNPFRKAPLNGHPFIPAGFAPSLPLFSQETTNILIANTLTLNYLPSNTSLYSPFIPLSSYSPFFGNSYQTGILNAGNAALGRLLDILA